MVNLSKSQYKMLCKVYKANRLSASTLTEKELEICRYLMENDCLKSNYVSRTNISGKLFISKSLPSDIEITQTGEAQIYIFRSTFYKWWIPVVISVFALISSVLSILM